MENKTSKTSTYTYQREQICHTDQHLELSRGLDQLRNQNILCDITISVGERYFPAHKTILVASSKYFYAMFTSGFREAAHDEITIHGNSDIFDVLLQFIYTGKLTLTLEIAPSVLEMACYLQLDIASKSCATYLIKCFRTQKITFEEALKISLLVECLPEHLELKEWCDLFISENLTKIQHLRDSDQYFVNAEMMSRLLDRNDLDNDEEEVLRTVLAWLKYDLDHRQNHAIHLLRKVRIGLIPVNKLLDIIMKALPELLSIREYYTMLEKIFAGGDPDGDLKHVYTTRTTITAFIIPDNYTSTTYYLNDQLPGNRPQWRLLSRFAPIPVRKLYSCNMLVVDEQLYLAGGVLYKEPESDDSSDEAASNTPLSVCQSSVYRYTVRENQWQRLQDMKVSRCQFALVHHNGYIYAIGGSSANDLIRDVECYNLVNKEWEHLPPLLKEGYMGKSSAVSFRGKIFVYAAESRKINGMKYATHNLQVFDPETRSWHVPLTEQHNQGSFPAALVVHNDTCYRVVYGNCKCTSEHFGCPWHKVCVHELVIDDINGTCTARVGDPQDQSVIPKDQTVGAFCIQDDVFVTVNGVIHMTDDSLSSGLRRDVDLTKWNWSSTIGLENCVAKFRFDKALLE
ncbi:kelch-like protein 15 [Amphiura filiformis]|uniref:kelch-like protein 15 n=1 Tax=Amphiura filiformis TaxID=82378 RepID=UPI003B22501C